MNRLAITKIQKNGNDYTAYIMLNEARDFVDFQLFEPEESILMDRIYIGKVENIVTNIQAAFIRIGENQKCFLSLEDVSSPIYTHKISNKKDLCVGDELLVQVIKDAVKTKDPVVTTKLTLSGKYSILTTDNCTLGISKKISSEKKKEFTKLFQDKFHGEEIDYGIVIRTNAQNADIDEVGDDINNLIEQYQQLITTAIHRIPYSLVYQNEPGYIKRIKATDFTFIDQIYTDDSNIYNSISQFVPIVSDKLHLYQDDAISLSTLYHIKGNLEKLTTSRVWLDSGANIIIESLETLTIIDVNTGKNISRKDDIIFQVNMEAAIEIAKQLRLRNISGMIIIDFINMKKEEHQKQLIACLKQEIKKDPVTCNYIDITKLGLVELTRKKVYKSLKETLKM